jgi:hypothetical protein
MRCYRTVRRTSLLPSEAVALWFKGGQIISSKDQGKLLVTRTLKLFSGGFDRDSDVFRIVALVSAETN